MVTWNLHISVSRGAKSSPGLTALISDLLKLSMLLSNHASSSLGVTGTVQCHASDTSPLTAVNHSTGERNLTPDGQETHTHARTPFCAYWLSQGPSERVKKCGKRDWTDKTDIKREAVMQHHQPVWWLYNYSVRNSSWSFSVGVRDRGYLSLPSLQPHKERRRHRPPPPRICSIGRAARQRLCGDSNHGNSRQSIGAIWLTVACYFFFPTRLDKQGMPSVPWHLCHSPFHPLPWVLLAHPLLASPLTSPILFLLLGCFAPSLLISFTLISRCLSPFPSPIFKWKEILPIGWMKRGFWADRVKSPRTQRCRIWRLWFKPGLIVALAPLLLLIYWNALIIESLPRSHSMSKDVINFIFRLHLLFFFPRVIYMVISHSCYSWFLHQELSALELDTDYADFLPHFFSLTPAFSWHTFCYSPLLVHHGSS